MTLRASAAFAARFVVASFLLSAVSLVGCGSRERGGEPVDEAPSECREYIAALSACAAHSGAKVGEAMVARTKRLEAEFVKAAHDEASRASVGARCASAKQTLSTSCR